MIGRRLGLVLLVALLAAPASAQFTIPNNTSTAITSTDQTIWMQADVDALVAGIGGNGVVSGCGVTAQASPTLSVAVASGQIKVSSSTYNVTLTNLSITASSSVPRIDLVVASAIGASVVTGTPSTLPAAPALPASSVALAAVYVPARATAIRSTNIVDKRVLLTNAAFGACAFDGSNNLTCPGSITAGGVSAGALDLPQGTAPSTFPSNAVSIVAPTSVPTSYHITLPGAPPASNGYALTSDTLGNAAWAAAGATPGGVSTDVQCNISSALAACDTTNLTYNVGSHRLIGSQLFGTYLIFNGAVLDTNSKSILDATAPTIASGFGTSPTVTSGSRAYAFEITVGTVPGTTGSITLPIASTGWVCTLQDMTNAITIRQTARSTTSASFTASVAPTAADKLVGQCIGF